MVFSPLVYFSNKVENLYFKLKHHLFHETHPFAKRMVIVPSAAMKKWLMYQMAQDPELTIATGIECGSVDQSLMSLFYLLDQENHEGNFPAVEELSFAIEIEIKKLISEKQSAWQPLLNYLKISQSDKGERRIIALADKLGGLFLEYGKYGGRMLQEWVKTPDPDWQQRLWLRLEEVFAPWAYPYRTLDNFVCKPKVTQEIQVHLFALSYVSPLHHRFLTKVAKHCSVNYYLLSPCQMFWSDLLSERESHRLTSYWKKRGASETQQLALEEYLRDSNPLLANFGRLGREMATQIENSHLLVVEDYLLPGSLKNVSSYEELLTDEVSFEESVTEVSLLEAVQADMLLLRTPNSHSKIPFCHYDETIQIHRASRQMQEVQILYNAFLKIIERHAEAPILPSEIIVMAPNIMDYEPYIRSVFGSQESVLEFQILDVQIFARSPLVQGFLHLLDLSFGRWEASAILRLFDCRAFQLRHQLTSEEVQQIRQWIREGRINWGKNPQHRNEILKREYCESKMIDQSDVGTWKYGFGRLLASMAMISDHREELHFNVSFPPLERMEHSQGELLGKVIYLLQSLDSDLRPLSENALMTLSEWTSYLECLLEAYFSVSGQDEKEQESLLILKRQLQQFKQAGNTFSEETFSFTSIYQRLKTALSQETITYREKQVNAIKFCSFLSMRSISAKIIAILGMQEDAFPRKEDHFSLNLLLSHPQADYYPSRVDSDRYLFLEAILSSRKYLILTYSSGTKEQHPSLLVTELLGYLDQAFTIEGKNPSQYCHYQHPVMVFDKAYFSGNASLPNYFMTHYRAASAYYQQEKKADHQFVPSFPVISLPKVTEMVLSLKDLIAFARNPIKMHFNKTLGLYLEKEEERMINDEEEFQVSSLQKAILSRKAFQKPLNEILKVAGKEGKIPFGPFQRVNQKKIEFEVRKLQNNLEAFGISIGDFFDIEFSEICRTPQRLENGSWLVPPLVISNEIKLVGKLSDVTHQGFVGFANDDPVDAIKAWPAILAFATLLQRQQLPIASQFFFAKSGKVKKLSFECPERLLAQFIEYYQMGMKTTSPLIPEWVPYFFCLGEAELEKTIRQQWKNTLTPLYNDYLKWLTHGSRPHCHSMYENWREVAKKVFEPLFTHWYPAQTKDSADAAL